MQRRQFITGTAAVTAFTLLKPETVFGTRLNSAVRLGIIGCGNRGSAVISDIVRHTPAQLIGMADLFDYQIEKAKSKYDKLNGENGGKPINGSKIHVGSKAYRELIKNPDIDAVLISTPAYAHPEILEYAVSEGKHVYCEKPVSPDVAGCKSVMESGEKARGKLSIAIGFQIRHASPYKGMVERIQRGDIGEVVNVQLYYISSSTGALKESKGKSKEEHMIRNHFHFREISGGILLDQAIHMIDVCNWATEMHAQTAIGNGNHKAEPDFGNTFTNYQVIYGYPDDTIVSVHSTQFGPKFGDVCARFIGTNGIAEAHYSRGVFIEGDNPWDSGVLRGQEPTPEQKAAGVFSSSLHDSTKNKVQAFINSIETGKHINEAWSGANSTLSAILGRMSAINGRKVSWKEMLDSDQKYDLDLNLSQFDT